MGGDANDEVSPRLQTQNRPIRNRVDLTDWLMTILIGKAPSNLNNAIMEGADTQI